jgi:MatE
VPLTLNLYFLQGKIMRQNFETLEEEEFSLQLLTDNEEFPSTGRRRKPSFIKATVKIVKDGLIIVFCYPYAWQLFFFSSTIKLAATPGNETQYIAAGTLFPTIYDAFNAPLAGFTFPVMTKAKEDLAEFSSDNMPLDVKKKLERSPRNGFMQAILFMVPAMFILFFSKDILASSQNETVAELSAEFLRPGSFIIPLYMVRGLIENLLYAGDKKGFVVAVTVPAFLVSILISYGLSTGATIGPISFPKMGIPGFFWGAFIENILTTVILAAGLRYMDVFKGLHFFRSIFTFDQTNRQQARDFFKASIPIVIIIGMEWLFSVIYGVLAGYISVDALAAYTEGVRLPNLLGLILAFAFGQATSLEISHDQKNQQSDHNPQFYHPVQARFAHAGVIATALIPTAIALVATFSPDSFLFLSEGISETARSLALEIISIEAWHMVLYNIALNMLMALRTKQHITPNFTFLGALALGVIAAIAAVLGGKYGVLSIALCRLGATAGGLGLVGLTWVQQFVKSSRPTTLADHAVPLLEIQREPALASTPKKLPTPRSNPEPEPERTSSSWCHCFSFSRTARRLQKLRTPPTTKPASSWYSWLSDGVSRCFGRSQ